MIRKLPTQHLRLEVLFSENIHQIPTLGSQLTAEGYSQVLRAAARREHRLQLRQRRDDFGIRASIGIVADHCIVGPYARPPLASAGSLFSAFLLMSAVITAAAATIAAPMAIAAHGLARTDFNADLKAMIITPNSMSWKTSG